VECDDKCTSKGTKDAKQRNGAECRLRPRHWHCPHLVEHFGGLGLAEQAQTLREAELSEVGHGTVGIVLLWEPEGVQQQQQQQQQR
jgi:hypothetical protein